MRSGVDGICMLRPILLILSASRFDGAAR